MPLTLYANAAQAVGTQLHQRALAYRRPVISLHILSGMTPEECVKMNRLCQRIQIEKNPHVFTNLVEELNELLERKGKRLEPQPETGTSMTARWP